MFTGCKFIGRQDTLYGATGISAMFNQCDVLGAVDYIFGGMTAVFYRCQLRLNTSEADSDVALHNSCTAVRWKRLPYV